MPHKPEHSGKRLTRGFFRKNSNYVAQNLIGAVMVFNGLSGTITETEAYGGSNDPASHAYRGKTARNAPMFDDGGNFLRVFHIRYALLFQHCHG